MAENPHPLIMPYGLIYENGNQPQQLYNGKTFPTYWYEPNPITLSISTENDTEYLYLPVEKSKLDKALQRLGAKSFSEVSIGSIEHVLPQNIADLVFRDKNDFDALNEYAAISKDMGEREVAALSELAAFTKITTAAQLKILSGCMYEFERFSGIYNAEEYGRHMICKSGHFEYDENLEDYIDFESYGRDKISRETGAFTDKGYLLYHGYNQEMQSILSQTLGLKPKEIQEPQELKLYMPLKAATFHDENDYGDLYLVDFEIEVYPHELAEYEDEIHSAILDRRLEDEKRGMMDYYGGHDTVNAKVQKYVFDV
ncbi:MAG: antirestriction protein ArdA, partial [Oscillospiraceae bacterium]|nr:antirestriction protein ArdA [Oscillospiraceae bacterium]